MKLDSETRIGDIVQENYKTAQVFEKYGIDFCCGGNRTLGEACLASGKEVTEVLPEIKSHMLISDPDSKYLDSIELDELCDYIENNILFEKAINLTLRLAKQS